MIDAPRRHRLPSLEPMIEAYSRKAWYTVPAARTTHGVDPNAPREPGYFGPQVRLAARVVDVKAGGNPANIGDCECDDCECIIPRTATARLCGHDLECRHYGTSDENDRKVSLTLRNLVAHSPALAHAFSLGVDGVYAFAGLTPSETEVARYQHEGLSHTSIAYITSRKRGTVDALLARAHFKLKAVALDLEVAA